MSTFRPRRKFLRGGSDGYEATMKETNRDEPSCAAGAARQAHVIVGSYWFVLVSVAAGLALITQRSLVQIQPPQP